MRKQKGEVIDGGRSWFLRYYATVTEKGAPIRKQKCVKLCEKSETYRTKEDVAPNR
jgi:hypothetical protein